MWRSPRKLKRKSGRRSERGRFSTPTQAKSRLRWGTTSFFIPHFSSPTPLPKEGRDGAPTKTNLTQSIQDKGCDSVPVLLIVVPHGNLSKPTIVRAAGS